MKLVSKILSLNKEVAYLTFQVKNKVEFKSGQFLMFDKKGFYRAYSIASIPSDNKIGFYIKKVSTNGMSKYLVDDIKIGDDIKYDGPFGRMIVKNSKNYLLISIGSGLGPILSIYRQLIHTGKFSKIINIYGERYENAIISEILKEMKDYEKKNIKNYFCLSKEKKKGFETGYVQEVFEKAINFLGTDIIIYICGKPSMVDESVEKLVNLGIKKENINFEKF